ncbi:MAG: hypothetical protein ACK5C0_05595 [Candidatus Kapaibacterium sp.]
MKKYLMFIITAAILSLGFTSCKDDTTTAPATKIGDNITESQFPITITAGDPRGTYTPNTPAMKFTFPPIQGSNIAMTYTKNTGSGTLIIQGATPQSGTYTTNKLQFDIRGYMDFTVPGEPTERIPFPAEGEESFFEEVQPSGTWQIIGNKIYFDDNTEGAEFTVTDKGLFMYSEIDTETEEKGSFFLGLRKK